MIGVSTQCLFDKSLGLVLHKIKNLDVDFVEIVNEGYHELNRHNYRVHKEFLEDNALKSTIHAPFSDVNIGSLNEKIRRVSLSLLFETLEIAHDTGSLLVVIHPAYRSPLGGKFPKAYEKVQKRSLEEIDRVAEKIGIKVVLENMPSLWILDGQTPERIAELIDGTNLGVAFDVGHLNTTTRNFDEFIELLRDRIEYIHLSDNNGTEDSHLALGEGTVPWREILKKIPRVPMSLEVRTFDAVLKSLNFLEELSNSG
ncbi:sugar phosphate isomerase/epimerase [Thermococcus aggregans]|uniref:Sugar phosphate isomerase/epimerase n=1 Tax=Thermococcus aggregans TaxID=110163 RepID=A0A9E7MW73_THEAG|nr:sugar phosphate isomerase/epimerase [Thermococcus aggregans]USS40020.1 sugar phosphate isomerase/epimerase [Thermococcus aggregans]